MNLCLLVVLLLCFYLIFILSPRLDIYFVHKELKNMKLCWMHLYKYYLFSLSRIFRFVLRFFILIFLRRNDLILYLFRLFHFIKEYKTYLFSTWHTLDVGGVWGWAAVWWSVKERDGDAFEDDEWRMYYDFIFMCQLAVKINEVVIYDRSSCVSG